MIIFFFFQAEDGIRDLTVTGVQTCALPICARRRSRLFQLLRLLHWYPGRGQLSSWPLWFFITGRGTNFIWRCTSRSRGSSAPGRSISFWHDITACITDTWTGTSMLCSLWLTMFLELAFGPMKVI